MNEVLGFINDKMKVLLILREHQVEIEGIKLCPLNQQEIANHVPCGKLKANQLINELIDDGYIEMKRSKDVIECILVGEFINNKFVSGVSHKPSYNATIRIVNKEEVFELLKKMSLES